MIMTITDQPILYTSRLLLRPFYFTDAPAVQYMAGDIAIASTVLSIPHPYGDGIAEQWISTHQVDYTSGKAVHFAIVLQASGQLIGAIGLIINPDHERAEMGYWIGKPFWGQGYCTEAAQELLNFAFQKVNLHRVFAQHFARNPASGRVMQKIGMELEGCLHQHLKKWDSFEDVLIYGIIQQDK